jgi:lipopolysaccharide export LptBFGC system permease protein LptF
MILGRSYFREILLQLALVMGGLMFLLFLGASVRATATAQGAPLWVALALVPLMVGNALPYFFPVGLASSVVLTYGRMAADGEEIALRSAGIHPWRLALPAIAVGGLIALLTYPLTSIVLPHVFLEMRALSQRAKIATLENTNPGASELHFRGMNLMWKNRSSEGGFRDVLLTLDGKANPSGNQGIRIRADEAHMDVMDDELVFRFEGMRTFSHGAQSSTWSSRNQGTTFLRVDLESLAEADHLPSYLVKIHTSKELNRRLQEEEVEPNLRIRYVFVIWQRWAMAVAAIPVALLGALLGWRLRRGGFLAGFAVSLMALLFFYYPLHFLGDALARLGTLGPGIAAWLPTMTLSLLVGVFFLRRQG